MEIAKVGLGKMGANMVTRLLSSGHRVIAYDINAEAIDLDVPVPVITLALQARFVSRQDES
jgi:6-phosphogluconate dehydrogenase